MLLHSVEQRLAGVQTRLGAQQQVRQRALAAGGGEREQRAVGAVGRQRRLCAAGQGSVAKETLVLIVVQGHELCFDALDLKKKNCAEFIQSAQTF